MDHNQINSQMMEFNRMAFDNNFNTIILLQDQTQKIVFHFLDKATWLPNEGKKVISEWLSNHKSALESFKIYTSEYFKKAGEYFTISLKEDTQKAVNKL
jgi:hypothetical protein